MQEVIIRHLTDFTTLVSALFAGYLINGWPFFLAHIFVALLIRNSWLELDREKEALRNWNIPKVKGLKENEIRPFDFDNSESSLPAVQTKVEARHETIVVLEQFVAESRALGSKGFFVPMTDFSDRLDSAVEGRIAELHDRTNLFLFVGIAGTMFGVFEFAFKSYTAITSGALPQAEKVIKLAEYLSGSMSKAFPVGFFGLLFTFIAQVIATRPEQRLRRELSEATRKALEAREVATHSQGELLHKAAAAIAIAMEPLKDLRDTLSESLKPVVALFGERVDKSVRLLENQFNRVEETSAGLQSAVENLKGAVSSVASATKSLESLIAETPKVINHLLELEEKHEGSLDKIELLFTRYFQQADLLSISLRGAVTDLSSLSQRVIEESREGIKRVEEASVSGWTGAADKLRSQLERDLALILNDAKTRMSEVNHGVENALKTVSSLASLSAASIAAIGKLAPEIAQGYAESLGKMGKDSIVLWEETTNKLGQDSQRAYLAFLDKVEKGASNSSDALTSAAAEWDRLARNSERIIKEPVQSAVSEARRDLVESIRSLDNNVADRIKQFSDELQNLQHSTVTLVDKVHSINASLSDWATTAGPVTDRIKKASDSLPPILEKIEGQSQSQQQILQRIENTAEKLASLASAVPVQPKPKANVGSPTPQPIPTKHESVWWNPRTWF